LGLSHALPDREPERPIGRNCCREVIMGRPAANFEPDRCMTREEYRAWAEGQSGRFERIQGIVVAMAPERIGHAMRKARVWAALDRAVREAGLPCQVLPDGITIEVEDSDYEPDAVLRCGERLSDDAIAVPDPLVIVEVLSPTTGGIDRSLKLREYFRLPSLHHYLIVWPDRPRIVHHQRASDGQIRTKTVTSGQVKLDPPRIEIAISEIYADLAQ
jgi:Uma2 family endonuclease